ncbi:MAG: LOG family protein [Rhizobiales bacterium]|nr:LOG family protein [Hyphomicrobiales bacterium]
MESPSYRLSALDPDFLLGDSMRGVRFLLEYAKPEEVLREKRIRSTIVVFGSARILPGGSADPDVATAPLPPEAEPVPGARSARWYSEARRFARIVSERGGALTPADGYRDNVIATGGGPGIMEAANRGAADVGAPSIGFNIQLPHEQGPNAYSTPDLTFQFHYFAMRKMHFAMRAAGLVAFPGGFGTLDELFEVLALVQTGKMRRVPIVCFDSHYWKEVINMQALIGAGMISEFDPGLLDFADDAEEAWNILIDRGLRVPADLPVAAGGRGEPPRTVRADDGSP